MAEPRMNELAEELLRSSREGNVPWEERPIRGRSSGDSYRVVFPDGALILLREGIGPSEAIEDEEGGFFEGWTRFKFQLDLLSDTGRIIDSLASNPEEPIYDKLMEIFDLAEGYVRDTGIDKALDFLKSR